MAGLKEKGKDCVNCIYAVRQQEMEGDELECMLGLAPKLPKRWGIAIRGVYGECLGWTGGRPTVVNVTRSKFRCDNSERLPQSKKVKRYHERFTIT